MALYLLGKDIVILASANYKEPSKSVLNCQHLTRELACRGNRVLFVETVGLKVFPFLGRFGRAKLFNRLFSFIKLLIRGPYKPEKNIFVLSLIRLPYEHIPFIKSINEKILSFYIKRNLKKLEFENPVVFSFLPVFSFLKKKIKSSLFVFYCVDEFSEIPGVNKRFLAMEERKMVKESNIIFVVSPIKKKMFEEYSSKDIVYLNNVVDLKNYTNVSDELPPDLKKIMYLNKPIVGLMGNLAQYKDDFKLLEKTISENKDKSFVLIGSFGSGEPSIGNNRFIKYPNFFYLGPKEYKEIPVYLQYFDVAIIARNIEKAAIMGFPMKYFEFLASKVPTIITGVGSVKQFSKLDILGGIASTPAEFKERMNYWITLKQYDRKEYEKAQKVRLKMAKQNSWDVRMKEIEKLLMPYIKS